MRNNEEYDMHQLSIEWGCVTNLMDKISDIVDENGDWMELIDMVTDAVQEEMLNTDHAEIFFNLYQFFFRLYYRLKANPEKRPFNKVTKTTREGEDVFMVQNYDYDTYKWLKTIGCSNEMANDFAYIPAKKLSDKQRRAMERKAK